MADSKNNELEQFQGQSHLPRFAAPKRYDLNLKPDLSTCKFSGSVEIVIDVAADSRFIVLNSVDLSVEDGSVSFRCLHSGKEVYRPSEVVLVEEDEILVLGFGASLPMGEGVLVIQFTGTLNDQMKGFYRSVYEHNGEKKNMAVTQFEPADARRCFPCWDEPAFKATFKITLEIPSDVMALSNMPLIDEKISGQLKMLSFQESPIMSTCLVAIVVGLFDYVEKFTSDGIKARVYSQIGKTNQGKFALEVAVKTLDFCKKYFSMPYALPKLDMIAIPDFAAGATDNYGLVTYRETAPLYDDRHSAVADKPRDQRPKKATIEKLIERLEKGIVADEEFRRLIKVELARRLKWGYKPTYEQQLAEVVKLVKSLKEKDIAMETETLDSKLYQVPMSFLKLIFGKSLKESCCYFKDDLMTLDEAETAMLDLYCERVQIRDGQKILDLGCGQGPFALHVAQKYRNCHITGVTNSIYQKDYIEEQCKNLQLSNVEIVLEDITKLELECTFDRIVTIGLLEHLKNYEAFLKKVSNWMTHESLLFVEHVCHKTLAYEYEPIDEDDWYTNYMFPAGTFIMPSVTFLLYFQNDLSAVDHWTLNGMHFGRTMEEWLKNMDKNMDAIQKIMEASLGNEEDAMKLVIHWRQSCMIGSELCMYNNGEEWMGSHVLFKKK